LIFGAFDFCMNSFGEAVSCCLVTVISLTEGLSVFFLAASAAETNQNAASTASAELINRQVNGASDPPRLTGDHETSRERPQA